MFKSFIARFTATTLLVLVSVGMVGLQAQAVPSAVDRCGPGSRPRIQTIFIGWKVDPRDGWVYPAYRSVVVCA